MSNMAIPADGAPSLDGGKRIGIKLKEFLHKKLTELPSKFSFPKCCIYKVPIKLRRVNEEAYTPRLVSIGPLHHGSTHLQAMEQYKVRCLHSYLERCSQIKGNSFNLESASDWAENMEIELRMYYQQIDDKLSREELSAMILLDGVFVVELLLKNYYPDQRRVRDEVDLMFETNWMINDLLHDMMLLENQLPYHVPFKLFENIKASLPPGVHFLDLAHKLFIYVGNNEGIPPLKEVVPKHLLDYLLNIHLGGLYPFTIVNRGKLEYPYTATVLQQAGVKFSTETTISRFIDIQFVGGVLTIPVITVNDWTETFFRNLIAFEQCHHRPGYVSSYVIFMDSLIDTSKDVDILVEYGIIKNSFGDSQQVADLFNNLYKEVITDDSDFHFWAISKELNDYRKDTLHQWKAAWYNWKVILRRDYFSNPWSSFSVMAAVLLLALTIVQTVCSLLQVVPH